jgi:hypothetical protein
MQGQVMTVTLTGTHFVSPMTVFLSAPSPLNTGIQLNPTILTSTTATVTWTVSINAPPGQHRFRVRTEGGTSNEQIFTIVQSPPTLTSLSPVGTGRGMSVGLSIHGTGFSTPVQIDAGPQITVSNDTVVNFGDIQATFTAAPDAAFGDHPVTITTALGTSNVKMFRVLPAPVITSYSPTRAFLGREFQPRGTTILLKGENFICNLFPTLEGPGEGVEVTTGQLCDQTSATIGVTVSETATLGTRKINITGQNGPANPIFIDIVPVPPRINAITPPYVRQGTASVITITGDDLEGGVVNVGGGGVTSTTLSSTSTPTSSTLTASLEIASDTPIGTRNLTVTASKGISDPATITITPPTWPDLTISVVAPPILGVGYDETYSITVSNVGTKETTTPITVTYKLFLDEKFVSVSAGWTCVVAEKIVTCTTATSIPPNSQLTFQLIATANDSSGHTAEVTVQSAEDYNTSNNTGSFRSQVISPPEPDVFLSSQSLQAGQQATVSLTMRSPFPHDVVDSQNTMELTFIPAVPGTPMDPAVQFATGGQKVPYLFRANTLTAEVQGLTGPLGFQTGTVAGTLRLTVTFKLKTGQLRTRTYAATVAAGSPVITAATAATIPSGFESVITMFASTKDVSSLTFRFNTSTSIQLACGGVSGCSAAGSTITFNVASLFNAWYAGNTGYGSLAIVRVPFNIQGSLSGTVTVTLRNGLGTSNSTNFTIP